MKKITKNNFEDEIEEFLGNEGVLGDGMVYESANVSTLPSKGKDYLIGVIRKYAMLFEDDKYFYVVMNDANLMEASGRKVSEEQRQFATDFSVERLDKNKYSFLNEGD